MNSINFKIDKSNWKKVNFGDIALKLEKESKEPLLKDWKDLRWIRTY